MPAPVCGEACCASSALSCSSCSSGASLDDASCALARDARLACDRSGALAVAAAGAAVAADAEDADDAAGVVEDDAASLAIARSGSTPQANVSMHASSAGSTPRERCRPSPDTRRPAIRSPMNVPGKKPQVSITSFSMPLEVRLGIQLVARLSAQPGNLNKSRPRSGCRPDRGSTPRSSHRARLRAAPVPLLSRRPARASARRRLRDASA